MPRSALTGTRIRERRTVLGLKQAELARTVEISPAYLNLIEHNRRRIGGKLLVDLARELQTDVAALTEGVETALMEGLRDAASAHDGSVAPEVERAEEFAGRFPGWAALAGQQRARIKLLEDTVEALSDRLTHDPFLSEALHEVLSTVTAIRATAGILANGGDIDPEWQARFVRNVYEDSQRLAEGSQSLVSYLDSAGQDRDTRSAPQDEVEAWLVGQDYHIAALEGAEGATDIERLLDGASDLQSRAARDLAHDHARRYAADAKRLPLDAFEAALTALGYEPGRLADRFGVDLACVLRRLASLPARDLRPAFGLVICDGSGTLTFRKGLEGFVPPRFGAACALWPLYQSLLRPLSPIRQQIEQPGSTPYRFLAYAVCQTAPKVDFDAPDVVEATMLFYADDSASGTGALPIGTSCRICSRATCVARREPSMLGAAL